MSENYTWQFKGAFWIEELVWPFCRTSQTPTHVHWPNPYLNWGGRIQVTKTECELTS